MNVIPIVRINVNVEILTKIINSMAEKYDCRVKYIADKNQLEFIGDQDCCKHITEETIALYAHGKKIDLPIVCPVI